MSGSDAETENSAPVPKLESGAELQPRLDVTAQQRLGRAVARYGEQLLCEPLPDTFLNLLAKLKATEEDK